MRYPLNLAFLILWLAVSIISCTSGQSNTQGDCLRLTKLSDRIETPSKVRVLFRVTTCSGNAPPDITQRTLLDDGNNASTFEGDQASIGAPQAYRAFSLLILDLSGSLVRARALPQLKQSAIDFVTGPHGLLRPGVDTQNRRIGVYAFDGRAELQEVVPFTSNATELQNGIRSLECDGTRFCADESTNLNGALVQAFQRIDAARQSATTTEGIQFTIGTVVTFTDGTDQASRVAQSTALQTIQRSESSSITIGLGGEIDRNALQLIGKDGFEFAANADQIGAAFDRAAARIERIANAFFEIEYCSPRRSGMHTLEIVLSGSGMSGHLFVPYNADGFAAGCHVTHTSPPVDAGTTCPSGQVACGATCADNLTDPNNCGICGTQCVGNGSRCANGVCSFVGADSFCESYCSQILRSCGRPLDGCVSGCSFASMRARVNCPQVWADYSGCLNRVTVTCSGGTPRTPTECVAYESQLNRCITPSP